MTAQATEARELAAVIGLEVHVQLETETKIFCGCSTDFGEAAPNTHTCPVCLGLPGSLPVLNEAAVAAALKFVKAVDGGVPDRVRFDRKNYFYPDLPKNFQISQHGAAVCQGGRLPISVGGEERTVAIEEAHLEEDPGSLGHAGGSITRAEYTLVDYNRAGVPLLEIVTAPDLRRPAETRAFLAELEEILEYLEIFDSTRDGSLRVDANISMVPAEAIAEDNSIATDVLENANRTEVKNISSHKGAEQALAYEITRQRNAIQRGDAVRQETRHWDENRGVTVSMRAKEARADYRYFPEADLPILEVDEWLDAVEIPELPAARRERFQVEYGLDEEAARKLTTTRSVAEFFEAIASAYDPELAATWVADNLLGELHYRDLAIEDVSDRLAEFERLIELVERGDITVKNAEEVVLRRMLDEGTDPDTIIDDAELGTTDEDTVAEAVSTAIANNPDAVADYEAGEDEALNYLVGQVMAATQGQADPGTVNELLRGKLDGDA